MSSARKVDVENSPAFLTMRKKVGVATSVVLTGGLYSRQAEEGSVYLWGLVFSAVLAYWLGYGVVAGFEWLRSTGSDARSGQTAKQASNAVFPSSTAEMGLKERVAALERLAGLHEKGLLSDVEFAAAKAELLPEIGERAAEKAGNPSPRSELTDAASFDEKDAIFFADGNGTKAGVPAWIRFSFWVNSSLVLGSAISAATTLVSFKLYLDRQESNSYESMWDVSESVTVALAFSCVLVAVLTYPFVANWLLMTAERTGMSEAKAQPLWQTLEKWCTFGFFSLGIFLVFTSGLEVSRCCAGATSPSTYRGRYVGILAGLLVGLVPWHALMVMRLRSLATWSERTGS